MTDNLNQLKSSEYCKQTLVMGKCDFFDSKSNRLN